MKESTIKTTGDDLLREVGTLYVECRLLRRKVEELTEQLTKLQAHQLKEVKK